MHTDEDQGLVGFAKKEQLFNFTLRNQPPQRLCALE